MNRYIIGFLAFVGLAILLLVLLFTGGGSKKSPPIPPTLMSYANSSAVVEMVINGPVVAPQNHNSLDISVGQSNATADLIQGYDGNVVTSKIYNNSENSFSSFLYALNYAGYTKSITSTYPGTKGLCSLGNTYDFYLKNNGQVLQHYWETSCGGPKTYDGDLGLTIQLFNKQIPDLNSITLKSNL